MEEKTEKKENLASPVFISLSQAAKISGYTAEHLNLLCRKKILQSQKVGRNWHTTQEWLSDFLATDSRNAHKRKLKQEKADKTFFKKKFSIPVRSAKKHPAEENFPETEKAFFSKPVAIFSKTKITFNKNKFLWLNLTARFASLILVGLLFFAGAPVVHYVWNNYEFIGQKLPVEISQDSFLFSNEPGKIEVAQAGKVAGEEAASASGSIAASENFRMREISFGGVLLASAEGENLPLEISDMKTKTFVSKDGQESQALISWQTNKEAVSEITYGRIDSQAQKTMQEESFGFNHAVALAKLDMGATYVFEVQARDKWDRTVLSDKFSVYTGSKIISVFDLIVKAINETFGWAMKN
jgi:hypothetical protein